MKRFLTGALACSLLLALLPTVVSAGGGAKSIEIRDVVDISSGDGTFVAYGPAVEAGWVCPSGETTSSDYVLMSTKNDIDEFTLRKTFTCRDGSGAWTALLDVRLNRKTARTTATWVVGPVAGSGAYVDLTAAGRLRGDPIVPGVTILDIYRGKVEPNEP